MEKGEGLLEFIDELKKKIAKKLNLNSKDISLVNPYYKNGYCSLDLTSDEINYNNCETIIDKLKNLDGIKKLIPKSLIEGCQLDINIFEPEFNNLINKWGEEEKRGGEDYLPPIGWTGFGLKVSGKYDNGDDTWLDYENKEGSFAIAYFGLSNIYGNKKNQIQFLNEIDSESVLKTGFEQIYKDDEDLRHPGFKCGYGTSKRKSRKSKNCW